MVKRLIGLVMLVCGIFTVGAQQPQLTPLPLNQKVLHGTLSNGLNYYVMSNQEPKGRANFYIAQKVGSTLETPQQLGLAHFLEHMAFNGTKNFPGKSMLEYLQNNGIRFGHDINAYTSFDETVYRINNVPTSNVALMDSVLLVLHDWSCDLLLEDAEIDSERGVIQEEWRQRNDANTRMFTAMLPQLYDEYQYTRMPIGTMEVVMNFPYKDLRDYYHKWYRPDQQGIVVVGDFDAKEMEQKVIKLFSTISMPENAAERTYPHVSDNEELRYVTYEDPELQRTTVTFSIKSDKIPFEYRNTLQNYMGNIVVKNLIASMINQRLGELAQKPECAFAYAGVNFGDYYVSKTKEALTLIVIPKTDAKAAFNEALGELLRSVKTGFTNSELARVKEEFKSGIEKAYNEREKTNSDALGQEIIRHFIDNEPAPGVEAEWEIANQMLPMIDVNMLNGAVSSLVTPNNQVLVVTQPKKAGMLLPTREEMMSIISGNMNKQFEAYVDNVIDEPMIAKMPKKGKITKEEAVPAFGATKLTLSNGATVWVKTTDFAADQVMFYATAPIGKTAYDNSMASNLKVMPLAIESSRLGKFDVNQLQKALADKQIGSSFFIENYSTGFNGASTVKDLESLMQVIYLQFTSLNPDETTYAAFQAQYASILANQATDPNDKFSREVRKTWYDGNIMGQALDANDLKNADYANMLKTAKQNLSNAADYDFIFVGNVDVKTLKPMLEQYIASLPGNPKKTTKMQNKLVTQAKGIKENKFDFPMESPAVKEFVVISGNNVPYTVENDVKMSLMGDILDMIYIRTLREEIGGTYGASSSGAINPRTGEWYLLYSYDTGEKTKQLLADRAVADLENLMKNGADREDFNKVKEAALSQFDINTKKNAYWMNILNSYATLGVDNYSAYQKAVQNLTLNELNTFMKNLYDGKNRVHVTLNGVQK